MDPVNVGIVGLGNVGLGTIKILAENAEQLQARLGFPLRVTAVCSRSVADKEMPPSLGAMMRTSDWRELVASPQVDVICELVGGTSTAREMIEAALKLGKPVITANKELLALAGLDLLALARQHHTTLAMEASVAGGIPIHTVLREGISGDHLTGLYGILNGTSNFILSEIESRGAAFAEVLAEAQRLGYAEADPTADVEGFDARSKLAILTGLAFGVRVLPEEIFCEGIRRVSPLDFAYAHQLGATIKLICAARRSAAGLMLSVRPSLVPSSNILANVRGAYNAILVRGRHGQDTFYYGRGAGPEPTGVAVVSDLMRVARDLRSAAMARVSPFAFETMSAETPARLVELSSAYYLRFRVKDQVGIIATLAGILAKHSIGIDAVLQLPNERKDALPFVITVEPSKQGNIQSAVAEMAGLDFMIEPPMAMPIEREL